MISDTSEMSAGIEIDEDRANDCDGDFTIRGRLMSLVEKVAYLKRKVDELPKKKKDKKPSKGNPILSPSLVPLVLVHCAFSYLLQVKLFPNFCRTSCSCLKRTAYCTFCGNDQAYLAKLLFCHFLHLQDFVT